MKPIIVQMTISNYLSKIIAFFKHISINLQNIYKKSINKLLKISGSFKKSMDFPLIKIL